MSLQIRSSSRMLGLAFMAFLAVCFRERKAADFSPISPTSPVRNRLLAKKTA
jgi:hypothetical protein